MANEQVFLLSDYERTLAYMILKEFSKNNKCGIFASKFRKAQVEYENKTALRIAEHIIRENVSLRIEPEE